MCYLYSAKNLVRLQLWVLSTFIVITYTKWQRELLTARSRLSSLKLISKAVIYFNYDYLSVEPAAHGAHSPFTMTGKWTRQADSQRKRERTRKKDGPWQLSGNLLFYIFLQLLCSFSLSLSVTLCLSLFCPWFVQNCCAFNYCDYCGNSLQFSIVATTPRLATPSQAMQQKEKKTIPFKMNCLDKLASISVCLAVCMYREYICT